MGPKKREKKYILLFVTVTFFLKASLTANLMHHCDVLLNIELVVRTGSGKTCLVSWLAGLQGWNHTLGESPGVRVTQVKLDTIK